MQTLIFTRLTISTHTHTFPHKQVHMYIGKSKFVKFFFFCFSKNKVKNILKKRNENTVICLQFATFWINYRVQQQSQRLQQQQQQQNQTTQSNKVTAKTTIATTTTSTALLSRARKIYNFKKFACENLAQQQNKFPETVCLRVSVRASV